ncbi:MAG: Carboxy-terminal processing protease CtpA precursor [Elusimicrobia bacterium ADurb.Bin231]|nr:MAG: Carboxy-terminal processing protease CtpA precursor [Elusimicrobia bacterium ADurb.Bin231]
MFKKQKWLLGICCFFLISVFSLKINAIKVSAEDIYAQIRILAQILVYVRENYVEEPDIQKLIYGAADGMVRTLDPFSQFMPPKEAKEMKVHTEGHFGGLGIRISTSKDGWITVVTPIPGTPAWRMGILPEDKIIKIEGEVAKDISTDEAVEKLRGKPGTKVTITIAREGTEPFDLTIIREDIPIFTITGVRMIEKDIGYFRITEMNAKTAEEMDKALADLNKRGMKSLVIDLRNDPGGLLSTAIDICKRFIGDKKLIVYTQGRRIPKQEYLADASAAYAELPIVVLVNRGSASGAEIVAGCMQDHKRALILGMETFGKGSVQSLLPLEGESSLRLTTQKYYTPSGKCIHRDEKTKKGGITPDVVIEVSRDAEIALQKQEVDTEIAEAKERNKQYDAKTSTYSVVSSTGGAKPVVIKDEVLERAVQFLKVRDLLLK